MFVFFDAWKWEILIKRRQAVERGNLGNYAGKKGKLGLLDGRKKVS
jgi:hypothetical protein